VTPHRVVQSAERFEDDPQLHVQQMIARSDLQGSLSQPKSIFPLLTLIGNLREQLKCAGMFGLLLQYPARGGVCLVIMALRVSRFGSRHFLPNIRHVETIFSKSENNERPTTLFRRGKSWGTARNRQVQCSFATIGNRLRFLRASPASGMLCFQFQIPQWTCAGVHD
jgi:hypothetical protein